MTTASPIDPSAAAASASPSSASSLKKRAAASTTQPQTPLLTRLGLFFAAGALLGTIFDGLHANHDVLAYLPTEIAFTKLAWWVPPEFGAGGLLLGLAPWFLPRPVLRSLTSPRNNGGKPSKQVAWAQLASALTVYGLSSFLPYYAKLAHPTTSLVLGTIFLATWWKTNRRALALATCGVVGVGGSAWEAALCYVGKFKYVDPDTLGAGLVTHWIFWIWAGAALAGVHLAGCYIEPVKAQAGKDKSE
ncbi:hypothetical protein BCR44DRAFT_51394 [Catenaria anguillulae PL171]|uniref:Insulin-induced protein-domain-containing protein n=1 Tax=Catenaria anguillulae PL171 TaxID=765915 RepID=A0A1Y2HTD2_9FUNG|nr:hypothetical protein BCR44DRAFT_51394 [Catenaria anguillulae PL171]